MIVRFYLKSGGVIEMRAESFNLGKSPLSNNIRDISWLGGASGSEEMWWFDPDQVAAVTTQKETETTAG